MYYGNQTNICHKDKNIEERTRTLTNRVSRRAGYIKNQCQLIRECVKSSGYNSFDAIRELLFGDKRLSFGIERKPSDSRESEKGLGDSISPDGDDTIAKLYKDGSLAQVDVVSRYYKDEYNMEEAVKEVVKKLFEPRRFTGRAMFVGENTNDNGFTRGKIYQFTDGQCIDDDNHVRPYDYAATLDGDDWYSSVFIKVVE